MAQIIKSEIFDTMSLKYRVSINNAIREAFTKTIMDRNDIYTATDIHREFSYKDCNEYVAVEYILTEANLNPDFDW